MFHFPNDTRSFFSTNVAQNSIYVAELHTRANVLSFPFSAPRDFSPFPQAFSLLKERNLPKSIRSKNNGHKEPHCIIIAKIPLTPAGDNCSCILFANLHLENCNISLQYFVPFLFYLFFE